MLNKIQKKIDPIAKKYGIECFAINYVQMSKDSMYFDLVIKNHCWVSFSFIDELKQIGFCPNSFNSNFIGFNCKNL